MRGARTLKSPAQRDVGGLGTPWRACDYCMTQVEADPLTKQQSPDGQSEVLMQGTGGCTKIAFRP
jgi:hypothetical protein